MEDTRKYLTKNLNLGAFLYSTGLTFHGATRVGQEFHFIFSPRDQAEHLTQQYFAGTATVNPRDLFSRLHDLKDIIFSQEK